MRNYIVSGVFLLFIFTFGILFILTPSQEFSYSERRRFSQFPEFTTQRLFDGRFFRDFEAYATDQFPMRETFRGIKVNYAIHVSRISDYNGFFAVGDHIFRMNYPTDIPSVERTVVNLNRMYADYFSGMNTFFAMVPDRNFFIQENRHLTIDYALIEQMMHDGLHENINRISIKQDLSLDDFYRTDTHWSQDRIVHIASGLVIEMTTPPVLRGSISAGLPRILPADENILEHFGFTKNIFNPFYGVFFGQSAMGITIPPDDLIYLTSEITENAVVSGINISTGEIIRGMVFDQTRNEFVPGEVYPLDRLGSMDSYDVFIYGAFPLIILENPEPVTGRELILVRDSFGSAIAPLFLYAYDKIYVVDTRYLGSRGLERYIDFNTQDVLFLLSTMSINNSAVFFVR